MDTRGRVVGRVPRSVAACAVGPSPRWHVIRGSEVARFRRRDRSRVGCPSQPGASSPPPRFRSTGSFRDDRVRDPRTRARRAARDPRGRLRPPHHRRARPRCDRAVPPHHRATATAGPAPPRDGDDDARRLQRRRPVHVRRRHRRPRQDAQGRARHPARRHPLLRGVQGDRGAAPEGSRRRRRHARRRGVLRDAVRVRHDPRPDRHHHEEPAREAPVREPDQGGVRPNEGASHGEGTRRAATHANVRGPTDHRAASGDARANHGRGGAGAGPRTEGAERGPPQAFTFEAVDAAHRGTFRGEFIFYFRMGN